MAPSMLRPGGESLPAAVLELATLVGTPLVMGANFISQPPIEGPSANFPKAPDQKQAHANSNDDLWVDSYGQNWHSIPDQDQDQTESIWWQGESLDMTWPQQLQGFQRQSGIDDHRYPSQFSPSSDDRVLQRGRVAWTRSPVTSSSQISRLLVQSGPVQNWGWGQGPDWQSHQDWPSANAWQAWHWQSPWPQSWQSQGPGHTVPVQPVQKIQASSASVEPAVPKGLHKALSSSQSTRAPSSSQSYVDTTEPSELDTEFEKALLEVPVADGDTAESKNDEDLFLLIHMETASNGQDVLAAAHEVLGRLTPETSVSALHLAARHGVTKTPRSNAHLDALLKHLQRHLPRLRQARSLSRLAWSLGKMEVKSHDSEAVMNHVCTVAPSALPKFTPQDMTNTLWGLARLYPGVARNGRGRNSEALVRLAESITGLCAERARSLTAQCLSNAMWSAARLGLHGKGVEDFMSVSLQELASVRQLGVFTPQGLANVLWALAELRSSGVGCGKGSGDPTEAVRSVCVAVAIASSGRLAEFQPQELSMLAWAIAKLYGRGPSDRRARKKGPKSADLASGRAKEVDSLLAALAMQATEIMHLLSPQSISNIAWALATLELVGGSSSSAGRDFICAAVAAAQTCMGEYSPQAVANLLWAAVRVESHKSSRALEIISKFSGAVAQETTLRMLEFTWRDLAGVAVALSHKQLVQRPEALTFATLLVGHAAGRCNELTPQLMLNIAQSAVRLGVKQEAMQGMVDAIAQSVAERRLRLNEVDLRQWSEVRAACPPRWGCQSAWNPEQ